ncbi:MAG: PmoA family protein [Pirellulales bacterium]|nr:PmoA family protein [Pirellulales bacterium]
MRLAAMLLFAWFCHIWAVGSLSADGFQWQQPEADHVDLLFDGRPALRYMMPKLDESTADKRNETFKPYHHVWSPDGATLLTKGPGGLFPHHRGLFYGFNKITYGGGKQCDTWHCTGKTYQSHEKELSHEAAGGSASQVVAIDWHGQDGEVFAHETRSVAIKRQKLGEVDGWLIDFASHLETADDQPIHLDGDPQHAGFHFRASQEVPDKTAKQTYYLRPDGKGQPGETRNWDHEHPESPDNAKNENLLWKGMSIVLGDKRFTIVYLDHPSNPKPSRYSERDYGRFGSYFVADVTKGQPLNVKYRLWIQAGEMTVEQCDELSKTFIAEAAVSPTPGSG